MTMFGTSSSEIARATDGKAIWGYFVYTWRICKAPWYPRGNVQQREHDGGLHRLARARTRPSAGLPTDTRRNGPRHALASGEEWPHQGHLGAEPEGKHLTDEVDNITHFVALAPPGCKDMLLVRNTALGVFWNGNGIASQSTKKGSR